MNHKLKYLFALISIVILNIACEKESIQPKNLENISERYIPLSGNAQGKSSDSKKIQQPKQTGVKKENKKSGKETEKNKPRVKVLIEKKAALDETKNILKSKAAEIALSRYALARYTVQRNELREILNIRPNEANLFSVAGKEPLSTDLSIIQQGISEMMHENLANLEAIVKAGEKEVLRQEADYKEAIKEYEKQQTDYDQTQSLSSEEHN